MQPLPPSVITSLLSHAWLSRSLKFSEVVQASSSPHIPAMCHPLNFSLLVTLRVDRLTAQWNP